MKVSLLDKLEEIKQIGAYAVDLMYGEDIGCDDLSIKPMKRNIRLIFTPVGCLGEVRCMYKDSVENFLKFNFKKNKPQKISNPPKDSEYKNKGYYIWGTNDGVERILKNSGGKK